MSLVRFATGLPMFAYHVICEWYWTIAMNHCGHDHPDASLILRRLLYSQTKVNEFLQELT